MAKISAGGLQDGGGGLPMKAVGVDQSLTSTAEAAVRRVLNVGVDGLGPFKGSRAVADEAIRRSKGDVEGAIRILRRTHVRLAGSAGFVTGLGGFPAMPVTIPANLGGFYALAARQAAAIAVLRGYEIDSEEVRSAIVVSLLGASGTEVLKDLGVEIGTKTLAAALKKVPGRIFVEINKKVGFRLFTKAGHTGVINLGKAVPLVGGPIGGTIDALSMRGLGVYACGAFPLQASEADVDAS